jgi:hypothetical protein
MKRLLLPLRKPLLPLRKHRLPTVLLNCWSTACASQQNRALLNRRPLSQTRPAKRPPTLKRWFNSHELGAPLMRRLKYQLVA